MRKTAYGILLVFLVLSTSIPPVSADDDLKRQQIERAVEKGILNIYDIPFATYVSLDMWERIDFILKANGQTSASYRLPGRYYSRPYEVDGKIWVFENTDAENREIHIFEPDTFSLSRTIREKKFGLYAGGVRAVRGKLVASGGSNQDVDAAVLWDTDSGKTAPARLADGHYITALAFGAEHLYAGSCGGLVSAWRLDDFSPVRTYATSNRANTSWDIFNRKPCLTDIVERGNTLVGVGEKQIFIWDTQTGRILKTLPKALNNSIPFFHGDYLAEYRDNEVAVHRMDDARPARIFKTPTPVVDLMITDEALLPDRNGPVMVIALHHNKGMLFYDPDTLTLLREKNFKGESLSAYDRKIFATDDQFLYRYDIHEEEPERFNEFLKTVTLDNFPLTDERYNALLARSRDYSDVINPNDLARRYLDERNISIRSGFKYAQIGERTRTPEGGGEAYTEKIYGYKLMYEIRNRSRRGYYITLMFEWSGAYGQNGTDPEAQQKKSWWKNFLLPPGDGKAAGTLIVGEKEPEHLFIYPTKIEEMPSGYYEGLMTALEPANSDLKLVDRYLKDRRVRDWHDALRRRRGEIIGHQLFRLP